MGVAPSPTPEPTNDIVPLGIAPAFDPKTGDLYIGDRLGSGLVQYSRTPGSASWAQAGTVVLGSNDPAIAALFPKVTSGLRFFPTFYSAGMMVVGTASECGHSSPHTGAQCPSGRVIVLTRSTLEPTWVVRVTAAEGNVFAGITTHAELGSVNGADPREISAAFPTFVDVTGDGFDDLVLGTAKGTLRCFVNPGSKANATWVELLAAENPLSFVAMANAFGYAMPHAVDIDADGKPELLVGSREGSGIRLFVQDSWELSWGERRSGGGNPFSHLSKLALAAAFPATYDIDNDGFIDYIVGDYYGRINVWLSEASTLTDTWSERDGATNPFYSLDIGLANGGQSWPTFADLNNDGEQELIVGGYGGVLRVFWRVDASDVEWRASGLRSKWVADPGPYNLRDASLVTAALDVVRVAILAIHKNVASDILTLAPAFGDLDNDGDLDLIIGLSKTPIRTGLTPSSLNYPAPGWSLPMLFFENTGATGQPSWTEFDRSDPRIQHLRDYVLDSIGTSQGNNHLCGMDFDSGRPCDPASATSAVFISNVGKLALRVPAGGKEGLPGHYEAWKTKQKFGLLRVFDEVQFNPKGTPPRTIDIADLHGGKKGVVEDSTSGASTARVDVHLSGANTYGFSITNGGSGYAPGDTITIQGKLLHGTSPENDCILTATGTGAFVATITGTPVTVVSSSGLNGSGANVEETSANGANSASFTVHAHLSEVMLGRKYTVTITSGGSNYMPGDTVVIKGAALGFGSVNHCTVYASRSGAFVADARRWELSWGVFQKIPHYEKCKDDTTGQTSECPAVITDGVRNVFLSAQRHIAAAIGPVASDRLTAYISDPNIQDLFVYVIFDAQSDFHTNALGRYCPTCDDTFDLIPKTGYFTEYETPFPSSLPYPKPVGAFYNSKTLVVGSTDGKLHLLQPTSVCNMPRDTSGAGGGCVHSFAGNCPNPYLTASLCSCAPGYVGTYCERCLGGYGNGAGGCVACEAGTFRNYSAFDTNASYAICAPCPIDTFATALAHECTPCGTGERTVAGQAACAPCAEGFHAVKGAHPSGDGSTDCVECPEVGSTCSKGALAWDVGMWAMEGDASKATKLTRVYQCFNPAACTLSEDKATIGCNTEHGYTAGGVLCGACDAEKGYVRSSRACAMCYAPWISSTATGLIALAALGLVIYLVVEHSFDAARGAIAPVIRKIGMSHLQLLGVLGVFKAKGTSTFNAIISKPAEVGGGTLTKLLPVSCLIGGEWQAYGTFVLNMVLPPVILALAALVLLPTWLIVGARQRKRAVEDAPTFGPKFGLPIIVGTACGHMRRAATDGERRAWAAPFDPKSRLIGVAIFIMFSLYPALVGSVASMLNCVAVNGKPYLIADVSIVCWEGPHVLFATLAFAFGAVYTLGVPAALGACILFRFRRPATPAPNAAAAVKAAVVNADAGADAEVAKCEGTQPSAEGGSCIKRRASSEYLTTSVRQSFGFVFEGYATERGPIVAWETLVMVRKLAVALVGAMMSDPYLQILAALLILVVSFGATAYVQPYEHDALNVLDALGLFTLIATQVLSIVYFYSDANASTLGYDKLALDSVITTVLVLANAAVLFVMIGTFLAAVCGCLECHARKSQVLLRVVTTPGAADQGDRDGVGTLPANWEAFANGDSGETYFHNTLTGETTWTRPVGGIVAEEGTLYAHPTTMRAVATPPERRESGGWAWPLGDAGTVVVSLRDPVALRPLNSLREGNPGDRVRWMTSATLELGAEFVIPPSHFGGWRPCAKKSSESDAARASSSVDFGVPSSTAASMSRSNPLVDGMHGGVELTATMRDSSGRVVVSAREI